VVQSRYYTDIRQESLRKTMKTLVKVADVTTEIRTEHLPNIIQDLRFSQRWLWRVVSDVMWHRVVRWKSTDIDKRYMYCSILLYCTELTLRIASIPSMWNVGYYSLVVFLNWHYMPRSNPPSSGVQGVVVEESTTNCNAVLLLVCGCLSVTVTVTVTVAEWCKAWKVLARLDAGTVASNPTRGVDVYVYVYI
jgi:hypothetical protein